ncbi:hypothetical protein MJO28_007370, partial [Puccinia striiformis f. sp. tritici]
LLHRTVFLTLMINNDELKKISFFLVGRRNMNKLSRGEMHMLHAWRWSTLLTKTASAGETQLIKLRGQPNILCPVEAVSRRLANARGAE